MNLHRQSAARRRLWVWVVGSTTALGYYFSQGVHAPRRTAVGVESPICGISDLSATVKESPSGRRWVLALTTREDPSAAAGTPASPWPLAEALREFQWPGRALTSRRLAPFQPTGTWRVEGTALRWEWDLAASGWDGDARLWARPETSEGTEVINHSLHGGPVVRGRWPSPSEEDDDGSGGYEQNEWDPDLWSTLSSGLEELPSDFAGDWKYGHVVIGDRGVYLVHTLTARDDLVALYAVSDEPAPRILALAPRARPLALSRDGRTLFFERGGVLWRLDLRKPLPALLDEVSVPELPDPLAARLRVMCMRILKLSLALALSLLFVGSLDGPVRRRVLSGRLLTAALLNDTGSVRVLLARGADANAKDEDGHTPLMEAIQDVAAVRVLLASGADVNAKDATGDTPLMCAVREDETAVVRLLLASGANVNAADDAHQTALMAAAYSDQADIVRLLIARGVRADASDEDGHTAMWFARWNWHTDIVELLKKAGAKE